MKIKYSLLPKWLEANLTNREAEFLLYVARFQDDKGNIYGLFYSDVCQAVGMCKQTFYSTLRALQRKGIITYTHNRLTHDFDIQILNNDFSYPDSYKEGYINVSRKVFRLTRFCKLKAKEKLLLLQFMKITHSNQGSYQIGTAKFYSKYTELLGVTKRVLRGYLHSLRSFFSIGIKDGKYYINYLVSVFRETDAVSQVDQFFGHAVNVSCRRHKITDAAEKDVKETITLIKQYRQDAADLVGRSILAVIDECIKISVSNKKIKTLNSKYLHKLVREKLGLGKNLLAVEF